MEVCVCRAGDLTRAYAKNVKIYRITQKWVPSREWTRLRSPFLHFEIVDSAHFSESGALLFAISTILKRKEETAASIGRVRPKRSERREKLSKMLKWKKMQPWSVPMQCIRLSVFPLIIINFGINFKFLGSTDYGYGAILHSVNFGKVQACL